jgi:aldehyde:ferredoxin oxidoreductase
VQQVPSLLGEILLVDLTTGRTRRRPFTVGMAEAFIGARGYNAALLWDLVPSRVDPLGAENALLFGIGPLTGTSAPSAGRTSVTTKSPATSLYVKSNVGGAWGACLRNAGYSFIVVTGRAERPIYLWIDDDKIELRDARHLWGSNVRDAQQLIHEELGDSNVKTAIIGPAGENLVAFASIMCSIYNSAARGGVGAVMGSKRLKAIAIRGTRPVKVAEPARFREAVAYAWELFNAQTGVCGTHLYGTAGGVPASNATFTFASYNFQDSAFDDASDISGQRLVEAGYLKRRVGCYSCPMSCHRYVEIASGPHRGAYTGGPEFETLGSLGAGCGVSDVEAVIRANELCNVLGLDTISTGGVIAWLLECNQRELNFDRDGLALGWGDGELVVELVRRIAYRQGIGDLLAMGAKKAAERLGQGSEAWAIQAKGLEQSHVDTRCSMAYALAFAVNPRGPDHLMTETLAERGRSPEMVALIEEITGERRHASQYSTEKRAEIVRWHEDTYAVTDSLGLCAFSSTASYYMTPSVMAGLFRSACGVATDERGLMRLGRKIVNMERAYNAREGVTRVDDVLPSRLQREESARRVGLGAINSPDVMNPMLDEYYALHGWDIGTGVPTRATLEALDLGSWADELRALGRLP